MGYKTFTMYNGDLWSIGKFRDKELYFICCKSKVNTSFLPNEFLSYQEACRFAINTLIEEIKHNKSLLKFAESNIHDYKNYYKEKFT